MKPSWEEIHALRKVFQHIQEADYRKAFEHSTKLTKQNPDSFAFQVNLASVMGDYAETLSGFQRTQLKKKSIGLMRALWQQARWQQDNPYLAILKNEYYWQTKQRLKQYKNGVARVRKKDKSGYYGQTVGAAWHAYDLAKKDQRKRSTQWAKLSLKAFANYLKTSPAYYNTYIHAALAHGVLGNLDEMDSLLKKAAKLSKKPIQHKEFEEIRELIGKLP